jgi:hypothetical protein
MLLKEVELEEVCSLKLGNELSLPVSRHGGTLFDSGSVSSPSPPLNAICNLSL